MVVAMMDNAFIALCFVFGLFLVWLWNRQRKLSALLKFGCVICVFVCVATGHPEEGPTAIISEIRPMVFPEPMMQAEAALANWYYNDSDHKMFLSDGYWPTNNTTIA